DSAGVGWKGVGILPSRPVHRNGRQIRWYYRAGRHKMHAAAAAILALALAADPATPDGQPHKISVVDQTTGRGVPPVEFRTIDNVRFVTDSKGTIAIRELDMLGQGLFFHIRSPGYSGPLDGVRVRGALIGTALGGNTVMRLQRLNIAERIYRITGAGIYAD